MRTTHPRLLAAGLVLALPLGSVLGTTSAQADPARAAAPTSVTKLVLKVAGCEGCSLSPHSYVDGSLTKVYDGPVKRVHNGKVTFSVPTARTRGLSVSVSAPFEGSTGAVSHVVFAYRGSEPGQAVTPAQSEAARKGSVCFAGTAKRKVTIAVAVRQALVVGNTADGSKVLGAAAYSTTTQRTLKPFYQLDGGYFGAQDVPPCTV